MGKTKMNITYRLGRNAMYLKNWEGINKGIVQKYIAHEQKISRTFRDKGEKEGGDIGARASKKYLTKQARQKFW